MKFGMVPPSPFPNFFQCLTSYDFFYHTIITIVIDIAGINSANNLKSLWLISVISLTTIFITIK